MEFPEVRLWGFAEGWRAPEKRLVGLGCESGMEFPLSKNFNELQKIYEEAQRSSLNDKVKGMPMGACHRFAGGFAGAQPRLAKIAQYIAIFWLTAVAPYLNASEA